MTPPASLEEDHRQVAQQLGRVPRGMLEVVTRCPVGHPQVIRTAALIGPPEMPEPFPTTFWLTCVELRRRLADLERQGLIRVLEERLAVQPDLRRMLDADHEGYAAERWSLLGEDGRRRARAAGYDVGLRHSGIGGIEDRRHLKCLHLHAAHHLARGSVVGRLLEEVVSLKGCPTSD